MTNLRFYARRESPITNDISLFAFARTADGERVAPAAPTEFRVLGKEDEGIEFPPLLRISNEAAQMLVDELWILGIRPSEGSGSAGSLAATQRHLEDMRAIVANSLGVEMPKK